MGSVLLEHWKLSFTRGDEQPDDAKFDYILSANLDIVRVDSFYDRCFVVEESPGIKTSIEVLEEEDPQSRTQVVREGRPKRKNKRKKSNQQDLHSAVLLVRHWEFWGQKFI